LKFATNTFTISSPALAPLGACVSPVVVLINRKGSKFRFCLITHDLSLPDSNCVHRHYAAEGRLTKTAPQNVLLHLPLSAPPVNGAVDMPEAMFCPNKCGGVCLLPTEGLIFLNRILQTLTLPWEIPSPAAPSANQLSRTRMPLRMLSGLGRKLSIKRKRFRAPVRFCDAHDTILFIAL